MTRILTRGNVVTVRNSVTAGVVLADDDSVYDYRRSVDRDRAALRLAILDAAGRLLDREGPESLSMRRVATEVNASTKVLYTMFGAKQGLIEELYVEGFDRLREANRATIQPEDPVERIVVRAGVYLDNAIANPHFYRIMFGQPIAGFRPSQDALARTRETFDGLVDLVRAAAQAGVLAPGLVEHPREAAVALWTAWHGVASLLLAHRLIDEAQARRVHEHHTRSLIDSLRPEAPHLDSLRVGARSTSARTR